MILAVDVGNTNITFGVYKEEKLVSTFRITTKTPRTSDEYGFVIADLLKNNQIDKEEISGTIISSVVPNVMHALENAIKKYLDSELLIVGPGIKTGIKLGSDNPREVGADRIVDVVAAYEKYGGPALVIDFGTATTYDFVSQDGEFSSGVTAPGLRTAAKALWQDAAKLPEIEIKKPKNVLGRDTISSMQSGLVFGQIGQTNYIISKIKEETKLTELKVIATGGLGRMISNETDSIDIYDCALTLDGLRILYEKNTKRK